MGNLRSILLAANLRQGGIVLMLLAASGCALPRFYDRGYVAGGIGARTGLELGESSAPLEVAIPENVDWQDGIGEEEAVMVALWNSPPLAELLADLELTRADLIEAAQLSNPEVWTMFPVSAKQWEFALRWPLEVIWQRPRRIAAAELESQRVGDRLVQDGLNAIRDVRVAHTDLVLAQQRGELAQQSKDLRGALARMAESRVRAGAAGELEISPIRVDALNAQVDFDRAQRDIELAQQRLRALLGLGLSEFELHAAASRPLPLGELDVESLVGEALASRPDLQAAELAMGAAAERGRVARRDIVRVLGFLPDLNSDGERGFEAGPGLQFTLPIFHQNQGAIARAGAQFEQARRRSLSLRETITLEVRQAATRYHQARDVLATLRERVVPLTETSLTSARKALVEGGAEPWVVLESTRQVIGARDRELQAVADLRRAAAELERSVGRRLFGFPGEQDAEPETLPRPLDADPADGGEAAP